VEEVFSTVGVHEKDRFQSWRAICEDRLVPMIQKTINDEPFQAKISGTSIGGLNFTQFGLRNLRAETSSRSINHKNNKPEILFISLVLSGSVQAEQNDRSSTDMAGDFSVRDTNTPWVIEHTGHSEVLAIEVPRNRLESVLGSARYFTGLSANSRLPTTILARSFLYDLLRVGDQLTPLAAERMATIGIDLINASLAERMAMEMPKSLYGTLIVQRAKTYISTNFGDPNLNPSKIAAANGVSLRRLQELFRESGYNIAALIWQQRLEKAAERLADPANLRMPLSELAFWCGFVDQAHFSRRFRQRFGVSPREYRHMVLLPD